MACWLLYVTTLRGTSPQIIFDGEDKPLLSEGIRDRVVFGTARKLTAEEGSMALRDLAERYPLPCSEAQSPEVP